MDLTPCRRAGTDPAAGELAVDLPARLEVRHAGLADFRPAGSLWGPSLACDRRCRTLGCRSSRGIGGWNCRRAMPTCSYGQDSQAAVAPSASAAACWAAWDEAKTNRPSTPCAARIGNRCCVGGRRNRPAGPGTDAETRPDGRNSRSTWPMARATVIVIRRAAIDAGGLDALFGHRRRRRPGAFPAVLSACCGWRSCWGFPPCCCLRPSRPFFPTACWA